MPSLGGWEWVIIAVVALVLFGGAKLANFGKNAGKAIREFKEETKSPNEVGPSTVTPPAPQAAPQPAPHVDEAGPKA
ncbi:MAG: twin-arginine translocase TatA/TatE family subunit [Actinobacteria bacterium]|nr:twin-arginine translocase TatA/TatE family subunit [Actinomycetota bacterium]